MPDLNSREWAALIPMVALMILLGMGAQLFLPSIGASNATALSITQNSGEQQVKMTTDQEIARAQ
jgi:hypothetical protein